MKRRQASDWWQDFPTTVNIEMKCEVEGQGSKPLWILLVAPFVCSVLLYALAWANVEGLFTRWQSISKPPEKPSKLLAIVRGLWVETQSGNVYLHEQPLSCTENCWAKSDYPEPDLPGSFLLKHCGRLPSLDNVIDTKATCKPRGPGRSLHVYAIRENGSILFWNHNVGEGDSLNLFFSPWVGAVTGFFIGLLVVALTGSSSTAPS